MKTQSENITYHVISRGNKGNWIILDDNDFEAYRARLATVKAELPFDLYHYSLLNNHVHLIMNVESPKHMGEIMKNINREYARSFNHKNNTKDHVWRNRPKRFIIDNDAYLLTAGIYIELNAVRAGLADTPESYRWSSAKAYLSDAVDPLVTYDPTFLALGNTHTERVKVYQKLIKMWSERFRDKKDTADYFKKMTKSI